MKLVNYENSHYLFLHDKITICLALFKCFKANRTYEKYYDELLDENS